MPLLRGIPLSVVALVCLAAVAPAQTDEPRPGARVRVTAPGVVAGEVTASVVARSPDSITVVPEGGAAIAIPLARVTSLEVSRGQSRSAGAARGVLWSVPLGVALGIPAQSSCSSCRRTDDVSMFQVVLLATTLCGAGIGALVGRERWDPLPLDRVRVNLLPGPGGPALGVRLAF